MLLTITSLGYASVWVDGWLRVDERAEKAGRKIRDAEISKSPYMLIVGEKEKNEHTVSVRKHGGEDLGSMKIEEFIKIINEEIDSLISNFK